MLRHLKPLAAAANVAAIVAILVKAIWYLEMADLLWIVITPILISAVTITTRWVRLNPVEVLIHGALHLAIFPVALTRCWKSAEAGCLVAALVVLSSALTVAVLTRYCLRLKLWRWQRKLAVKR